MNSHRYKDVELKEDPLRYRLDLQGLRAIAILLVILSHAGVSAFSGGFVGVDVFFVLSGYLITSLLVIELEKSSKINFLLFYARRFKRLLPALAFMLVSIYALGFLFLSVSEVHAQLASSPYAASWLSNIYFAFKEVDYFNELSARDLFLHTWSLGVEEQFYIIWPGILLLLFKVSRNKNALKGSSYRTFLKGLILLMVGSFLLSIFWSASKHQFAFYLMPARVWQFSLGALVFIGTQSLINRAFYYSVHAKSIMYLMLFIGLSLIIGSASLFTPKISYPGFWAILPTVGAGLVLLSGSILPKDTYNPLQHPLLVWIGDRSYSLYLWHWPIFMFGLSIGWKSEIQVISLFLLTLLMAVGSHQFIERPLWKGKWSSIAPKKVVLLSLLVTVCLVFGAGFINRSLVDNHVVKDISYQWRMDTPQIYKMPCDTWYSSAKVVSCVFGKKEAKKTVVLLGDSIGAQWFSLVPAIFKTPQWRTIVFTKSSCPLVDEDYFYPRIGKVFKICNQWRKGVLEKLDEIKPDVIIMGNAASYNYTNEQWLEGSSRVLNRLSQSAKQVLVIPGTPSLGFDGPSCISRNFSGGTISHKACVSTGSLEKTTKITAILSAATKRYSNTHILPLNDLVCPRQKCMAVSTQGVVVFRDSQHLTDSFVRSQTTNVAKRIEKLLE